MGAVRACLQGSLSICSNNGEQIWPKFFLNEIKAISASVNYRSNGLLLSIQSTIATGGRFIATRHSIVVFVYHNVVDVVNLQLAAPIRLVDSSDKSPKGVGFE